MPIAAQSTGRLTHPAAIRGLVSATGTDRNPARGTLRHGKAMANTDLKTRLRSIDQMHAMPKAGSVPLLSLQHKVHPGMDHLVTERAFSGLSGQGIQQRSGQNNFTPERWSHCRPSSVKTSRAPQATITPSQCHQRLMSLAEGSLEMLPIQAMKQREQRLKRHERRRSQAMMSAQSASIQRFVSQTLHSLGNS